MPTRLHSRARIDLADIYEYTVGHWGVDQADQYLDDLTDTFGRIERREISD